MVDRLNPCGHLDPHLRDNLVKLAAARDDDETGHLAGLLVTPITVNPLVLASRARRSAGDGGGPAGPTPLLRFLLLRALAERPDAHPASWHRAFTRLHDAAVARDDTAGRLHHGLALGAGDAVAGDLTRRLADRPAGTWLALLDATVATPDPRLRDASGPEPGSPVDGGVTDLVTCLHAIADPSVSSPAALHGLYRRVAAAYRAIADDLPAGRGPDDLSRFAERAERYGALADTLC
jgi:hypothetical protein